MLTRHLPSAILSVAVLAGWAPAPAAAQPLERRIAAIMARPEFRRSYFGMAFVDLATGKPIYRLNADKFFVPGSTTKVPTAATALELLGADYRFRTKVYRTGPIVDGALQGDLVLVASGDPNLSGRLRPNGTMVFRDTDHSYGSAVEDLVDGDPLGPFKGLAEQIKAAGVRRIDGRVMVDVSLFKEGDREGGTGVVLSPMVLNDNLIDVVVKAGDREGAPATLRPTVPTGYLRLINEITTGARGTPRTTAFADDRLNSDGTRTVTVRGSIPLGGDGMMPYRVPVPSRFAEVAFAEVLQAAGIVARPRLQEDVVDARQLRPTYGADHQVAEHVSPPMTEVVKIILKVSQNLHASTMPYVLGAVAGGNMVAGFRRMGEWERAAGLDVTGQSQGDGAGGVAHFTPDFMASLLVHMATRPGFQAFRDALPVLGKDGTLAKIQVNSPAAGQVRAKTGTFGEPNFVTGGTLVNGKGLAGYIDTKAGRRVAFAIYINNTPVATSGEIQEVVGQAIGEIAAQVWETR